MERTEGLLSLFDNIPQALKGKLFGFLLKDYSEEAKIEVTVIFGDNVDKVKTQVDNIGATLENLGYGYGIITVPIKDLRKIYAIKEIIYIELPKTLYTSDFQSNKASCIPQVWDLYKLDGKGVLVGFIDSGIDYTHPAFINQDGTTRIEVINDLSTGKIYSREDINKALSSPNPQSVVTEIDLVGHGTHVAGIACGGGKLEKRYYGVAYNSSIAMVKMTGEGPTRYAKSTQLMRGIKFLIEKSQEINMPLVINLSFSTNDGAHDGKSILEQYIDTVCRVERISFVIAAGNEGDKAHHIGRILKDVQNIFINIGQEEKSIILRLYKNILSDISVELINPQGVSSNPIKIEEGYKEGSIAQDNYFIYDTGPQPFNIGGEIIISLVSNRDFLVSGQWTLKITLNNNESEKYDIWLPIAEGLNEKTVFLQPDVFNTLGIPATVDSVISVGSYNYNLNSISSFSGRGAIGSEKPEIVAPGEKIESSAPNNSFATLSGTSMATPHVSGAAALLMQWGIVQGKDPLMYGGRVKYYLLKGAVRDRTNEKYPNATWGYGKLCLMNSMEVVQKLRSDYRASDNCGEVFIRDDYYNFIVEYDKDIISKFANIEGACALILTDRYAIASVKKDKIDTVLNMKEIVYIERSAFYTLSQISPIDSTNISKFHNNPYFMLRGQGVNIAILDTGIDYMNTEFMYEDDTTRIAALWDQTAVGNKPQDFNFGAEFSREDINKAIQVGKKGGDPYTVVNSRDEIGHGTATAGIAGARGKNPEIIGAAPDCEFIIVKLRPSSEEFLINEGIGRVDSTVYTNTNILLGIKYIERVSAKLNKPTVILMPLGTNFGGHDGSSIIERYIDNLSRTRGLAVVTGVGNEGNEGTHAQLTLSKTGDEKVFEVKVDELQRSLVFEIWAHKPDKVSLSIVSPSGELIEKIPAKQKETQEIKFVFEGSQAIIKYLYPEEATGDELIQVRINNIRGGVWQFKITGDYIVDGRVDAWLPQRALLKKDTIFLNPNQFTTLTVPSTSFNILTSAYYNQNNNTIIADSGRGYTRDGRIQPIVAIGGVNVLTTAVGGGTTTVTGSSAGSAVLAGAVALLFQWGIVEGNDPTLYSNKLRTYLIRGTSKRPGDNYPNPLWGYGILDFGAVFETMRGVNMSIKEEKNIFVSIPQEIKSKLKIL